MAVDDQERFRPRPSKVRGDGRRISKGARRFTSQVLRAAQVHGGVAAKRRGTGAEKGRGWVAARMLGDRVGARSRRVMVKTRLVVHAKAAPGSSARHLAYIQRDGVTPEGQPGHAYSRDLDTADGDAFINRGAEDRHHFRFIVSAEDGLELGDQRSFTRDLMGRMEGDLGTRLDWVAVDHYDTDNPHTHIMLRGVDQSGEDLVIARDYIRHGMRLRASLVATELLGPQTERELRDRLLTEVDQERWTSLDRQLVAAGNPEGVIDLEVQTGDAADRQRQRLLIGRLQTLDQLGLAEKGEAGWRLRHDAERVLRDLGERGDIIRTMQRAFKGETRSFEIFDGDAGHPDVVGRIARKGLSDEISDRAYVIVDGVDGKARYVRMADGVDASALPLNGIARVSSAKAELRPADRAIAALARQDGIYSVEHHRELTWASGRDGQDAEAFVDAHVRRLEALRKSGIVERLEEGQWRIPADFLDRAAAFEADRHAGVKAELLTPLSVDQQVGKMGATWLDRRLIEGVEPAPIGFGSELRTALDHRRQFLVEEGLAEVQGRRVRLAANLLESLKQRELGNVAERLADETGLKFRMPEEGETVQGVYRRSLQLVSGRFAMLDDGLEFSLVPWRPVMDQRLGQTISGRYSRGGVSWDLGRSRGPSV